MNPTDAARLLERLLEDPDFRSRFRDDPAATAREAGLHSLADQLQATPQRPLETLEIRQSHSSMAGVMLAAAVEGIGVFELSEHLAPQLRAETAQAADQPPNRPETTQPPDPDNTNEQTSNQQTDTATQDDDKPDQDDPVEEPDEEEPDEEEPDEEEPDEEEPDEEEPDEEEPDEEEPDEEEPDEEEPDDREDPDENDTDSDDPDDAGSEADETEESDNSDADGDGLDLTPIPDGYPGDSASPERIGAWMAHGAQKRGLPPELPVMASLVESGLENLPGGDADSVGFFQMRIGIWNQGEYAGYPERPGLQLDWFLDRAEAVRAQRVARGLGTDPSDYGEWIADVERPAEQYRGRYQLRLHEAQGLLRRALPDGDGVDDVLDVQSGSGRRAGPRAQEAVAEARKHLGSPYRWGGSNPRTGFDCSGLVQWAYARAGIQIPRVTDQQILAAGATKVDRRHLLPGDLVFFRDVSGYVHHVGMSLGGDRFIEAPRTGLKVRISSLDDPYYAQQFTGARRFDPPAPTAGVNEARVMPALRPDQVYGR